MAGGAGRGPVRRAPWDRCRDACRHRGRPDYGGPPVNRPFADLQAGSELRTGRAADTIPDSSGSPSPQRREAWEAGSVGRDTSDGRDTVPRADADDAPARIWDTARDPVVAARSASDIPQAGDPVDVATGDVLLFQQDVALPGVLPLVIGRAYRSSWRAGRWFGPSWASSFDQRLQIAADRIVGVFADGRILSWACRPGEDGPVPVTGLPVTGPRWRLERAGDGAYTVTDPQAGLVWRFERRHGEVPLVSVTSRGGSQVVFSYTEQGEPSWITHSGGYRVRVVITGGRIAGLRLTDPAGEVALAGYRYDLAGNLTGIINSSGQALRLSYDEEGRLAGWQDRNGISYRYSYDDLGRCVAGTGPGGAMSGRFR